MEFSETLFIMDVMIEDIKRRLIELVSGTSAETDGSTDIIPLIVGIVSALTVTLIAYLIYHGAIKFLVKKIRLSREQAFLSKIRGMACFSSENPEGENLFKLARYCWKIGYDIDGHTGRNNNMTLVSDIIYRMSVAMNLSLKEIALNYCASLVYDIGFLDVPGYIFMTEVLNMDERQIVKSHVMRLQESFDFVQEEKKFFFMSAAMFHHENMDATGYPEGLSGEDIPLIARMLHIAESYVSLTTSRAYHRIKKSAAALQELKGSPRYDQNLVLLLEKTVSCK